jgi:glucose uptake protein
MVIINSYYIAVLMCIITMLCWGSWANTQKLVAEKKWPFQLYYWDYSIGVIILSLIFAFTFGSMGSAGRPFLTDLMQAHGTNLLSAFIGGVLFNLSNIMLVIAIQIAGMAVAFPIGVGLALAIGVIVNYIPNPIGNPLILFLGVAGVILAIILTAAAYKKLNSNQEKNNNTVKGIVVSMIAGVLMGFFYRFVAASMDMNFQHLAVGKLGPYTAVVVFSVGLLISNFLWNSINMYKPITGSACTYRQYFKDGNLSVHLVGILGGIIWNIGMAFSILASAQAGPSISYGLGQGATLIAAIWGVFIWKEFKKAPKGTNKILSVMFFSYLIGLLFIILARIV